MQAKRNAPPGADSSELQRVQEFIRRLPKTELFLRLDPFAGESADVRQAFEALAAYCQREHYSVRHAAPRAKPRRPLPTLAAPRRRPTASRWPRHRR